MGRITNAPRPGVGADAPDFSLPSAQGGNLRLGMRTVRGPVVVAFFRGIWSAEDIEFFEALAAREDDINAALGSVVGVGLSEPPEAREFQRRVGLKSYVLYDHNATVVSGWGLLEEDPEHGRHALPATFIVDGEGKVSAEWIEARPEPEELLAAVSAMTGLPKAPEEDEGEEGNKDSADEKPARRSRRRPAPEGDGESPTGEEPKPRRRAREKSETKDSEAPEVTDGGEDRKSGEEAENPEGRD